MEELEYNRKQQFLQQLINAKQRIKTHTDEIKALNDTLLSVQSVSYSNEVRNSSSCTSKIEVFTEKKLILCDKIADEISCYLSLYELIRDKINSLESNSQKLVLSKRYLIYDSWDKIAEELNFSERYVFRVHKKALENLNV